MSSMQTAIVDRCLVPWCRCFDGGSISSAIVDRCFDGDLIVATRPAIAGRGFDGDLVSSAIVDGCFDGDLMMATRSTIIGRCRGNGFMSNNIHRRREGVVEGRGRRAGRVGGGGWGWGGGALPRPPSPVAKEQIELRSFPINVDTPATMNAARKAEMPKLMLIDSMAT